ncbi:hypothetical protein Poli38472_001246 [Pythium oligandrum]|uniref:Uncharacterized protein n=1 Tax=Pythium oligandrum TaxID=41045 RepID=A0A8K1FM88_PYTOL|nr:hypothetical protein Poli38472_001246 [Pythium oligandrum]|eukprot:TMW69090.1 hypothetical protein Poli38472_001246 [Pythium oligandrum]
MGFTGRCTKSRRLLRAMNRVEWLVMVVALAASAYVGWTIGYESLLITEMLMLRATLSTLTAEDWTSATKDGMTLATTILVGSFVSHLCSTWVIRQRNKGAEEDTEETTLVQFMTKLSRNVVVAMVALPIAWRNGWDILLVMVLLCPVVLMFPRVMAMFLIWLDTPASEHDDRDAREKQDIAQIKRILSHSQNIQALNATETATKTLDRAAHDALTTNLFAIANVLALGILLVYTVPVIFVFYAGYKTSGETGTTQGLRSMVVAIMASMTVIRAISALLSNADGDLVQRIAAS